MSAVSVTNLDSNATGRRTPLTSRPNQSLSTSSVTPPLSKNTLAAPQNSSSLATPRIFSIEVVTVSSSNGTALQKPPTSVPSQNSTVVITSAPIANGTTAARPTPVTSSHAITSPPTILPLNSDTSVPSTCFNLGFAYLHPEWIGN